MERSEGEKVGFWEEKKGWIWEIRGKLGGEEREI